MIIDDEAIALIYKLSWKLIPHNPNGKWNDNMRIEIKTNLKGKKTFKFIIKE